MYDQLIGLGDVEVVAPLSEQSGVGHSITYLHPLLVHEEFRDGEHFGWAVDGSPADCVKLAMLEFCNPRPDLVVSGINAGANFGINVLYSGTVAAAIEGAFFGVPSIAISLAFEPSPAYEATARLAVPLIEQLVERSSETGALWNVNFPESRPEGPRGVKVVSLGVKRHTDIVEKRTDPRGRVYFWSGLDPLDNHQMEPGTDIRELTDGFVTVTPMHFDLTQPTIVEELQSKTWSLEPRS